MNILVTYDVSTSTPGGERRLQHVARICQNHGQRVQNSVFECQLSESHFLQFRNLLVEIIDKKEDSIRIYHLGKGYSERTDHLGKKTSFAFDDNLII